MQEWLVSMGATIIPVIAIVGGVLVACIGVIAAAWRKNRRTEMEIALKQDMLQRGLSAEDIERVMKASRSE